MPRTSYCRKTPFGTFTAPPSGRCATCADMCPAAARARSTTFLGHTPNSRFAMTATATIAFAAREKSTWRCASGVRSGFIVIAMTTGR